MFYLFSSGGACRRTSAAGDSLSEDGSCECLFIRLSDGYAPQAYFSDAGKVGKSALGRPQPPFVCPIGRLQRRYRAATEIPLCLRLPRNRCGGSRTSPDGPRAEGCFFFWGGRKQSVFHSRRQLNAEIRFACPFNRATAEVGRAARRRSDARRAWQFSGCAVSALIQTD